MKGTNGDKILEKACTPSSKGKHEGVQFETKEDKTLGMKADTPSNSGTMGGKGRQDPWGCGDTEGHKTLETEGDKTLEKADTLPMRRVTKEDRNL